MSDRFIFVVGTEWYNHHLGYIQRDVLDSELRHAHGLDKTFVRRRINQLSPRLYGAIRLVTLSNDPEELAAVKTFLNANAPEIMAFVMVAYNSVTRLSDCKRSFGTLGTGA